MTDLVKQEPLKLIVGHGGGARFWLPYTQLDQVRTLFDRNKVNYWRNEWVFPFDPKNPVTSISISINEDPARVQAVLDSNP